MKIQLDIPKEKNRFLKILKAKKGFKNLQETLIYIINEFAKNEGII